MDPTVRGSDPYLCIRCLVCMFGGAWWQLGGPEFFAEPSRRKAHQGQKTTTTTTTTSDGKAIASELIHVEWMIMDADWMRMSYHQSRAHGDGPPQLSDRQPLLPQDGVQQYPSPTQRPTLPTNNCRATGWMIDRMLAISRVKLHCQDHHS